MRTDPSTQPEPLIRAEIERVLARNVGVSVPEDEFQVLLRNVPGYQRAVQRLRHLPLWEEEAPTPPSEEAQG